MPVDSKVTTTWEHTFTTKDATTMTVSGTKGGDYVHVKIYEPATGFGLGEQPSRRADITMTCAEWSALINLIGIK